MKNFGIWFLGLFCVGLFFISGLQIGCKTRNSYNDFFDSNITSTQGFVWRKVQNKSKDTVMQLFVQALSFNWLKPHQSPEEETFFGTGFFISNDGYIVSNFHVVDEAVSVKIQIPTFGKTRFDVDVIGICPDRDVALLKLTKESLEKIKKRLDPIPYLKFGDSDKVVRTQEILALGYPLGQEKLKSTQGIVSGRERVWGESYIQITAPLNKGNSGGPSLNSKGEVIGINTSGITTAQNVGYIIPINNVKSAIEDLRKIKFLRTPLLGGEFNFGNEDMVKFLNNPDPGGLYFSRIYKDTLLEKVGVKAGDMIYEINGHEIDFYGETVVRWSEDRVYILDLLNRYSIGQDIDLKIYRKGDKKEFNFKFELSKQLPIRRFYTPFEKVDYEIIGGMIIMELTLNHINLLEDDNPYLNKYKKRENQYEPRLIITHIFPDSPTYKSRVLWVGDVIEEVNGKSAKTLEEFRDKVREGKKSGFLTVKNDEKQFMVLSLEKIVEEEEKLAEKHYFKISKLIEELGVPKKEKKEEKKESEEEEKGIKLVLA